MVAANKFDQHIEYLLRVDQFFIHFWDRLDSAGRSAFFNLHRTVEAVSVDDWQSILDRHRAASERTKRFFLPIQEKDFAYPHVAPDWSAFVRNAKAKNSLYEYSLNMLQAFISRGGFQCLVVVYGGIKSDASIDRKLGFEREGTSLQQKTTDLWDVVRFRVVTTDLLTLREVGLRLWETFFEKLMRCRNYYYRPKHNYEDDPYRAVHFELEPVPGRMIEIQLISRVREAMSMMDHSLYFKRDNPFLSKEHEDWLLRHMWKANILDAYSLGEYTWVPEDRIRWEEPSLEA
jgi:hypothetical protein